MTRLINSASTHDWSYEEREQQEDTCPACEIGIQAKYLLIGKLTDRYSLQQFFKDNGFVGNSFKYVLNEALEELEIEQDQELNASQEADVLWHIHENIVSNIQLSEVAA